MTYRGRFLLALVCTPLFCAAQALSGHYALILADPPVAKLFPGRGTQASQYRQSVKSSHAAVRRAAAARGFVFTGEADTLLNAVFVTAPGTRAAELSSIPGVAGVVPMRRFRLNLNRAAMLVNAGAAWNVVGGAGTAGAGLKIAILDTGIDQTHPAFQDATLVTPSGFPICTGGDCAFVSNKVIVARSYVAMLAAGTSPANSRPDDVSPRDRTGHGTAVASVAAGNTNQGLLAITGIAPHAFLGNYKIFGSPAVNPSTSEDVIIAAADDAMKDSMDILSLSLGTPAFYAPLDSGATCGQSTGTPCDALASALETAAQAGMIVVAAAGNDGLLGTSAPGYGTITSPGDAPSVITVGATTNSHEVAGSVRAGNASFAAFAGNGTAAALIAPGVDVSTLGGGPQGCSAYSSGALTGSIAIVERGNCTFLTKLQNAQAAGAVGVIFYMADASTPIFPAGLAGTTIPAVMLSSADGAALLNGLSGSPNVSLSPALSEYLLAVYDQLAGFSSQGPVTGSNAMKPDLAAPGTNMYMAAQTYDPLGELYSSTGYAVADGTSFATPLVAGAAALVKQNHPGWTAAQVKSALVNSTSITVTQDDSGNAVSAQSIGAGKLDAGAAAAAVVTASPATLSFGEVPPLGGPQQILLTNSGAVNVALTIGGTAAAGVAPSFSATSLTLAPGASSTITVTLNGVVPGGGSYAGTISVTGTGFVLRIPYLFIVPTGVVANLIPLYGYAWDGTVGDTVYLLFKLVDTNGLAAANQRVTFRASSGATVYAATSATNAYGIAEAEVVLGLTPGVYTTAAFAGNLSYTFTASARALPVISVTANGASAPAGSPVAPGSFMSIFGVSLSDTSAVYSGARLPLALGDAKVSFDVPSAGISVPGYLAYASPSQINLQVPWELAGQSTAQLKVIVGSQTYSNVITLALSDYAPAFFEASPGVVSALDENYRVINASNPAVRGQTIQLYANGLGPVANAPASGDPASTTALSQTNSTATVTIGGANATVLFSGLAPGLVGLYQLNVTVPTIISAGNQPVVVSIGGQTSQTSGIAVQ